MPKRRPGPNPASDCADPQDPPGGIDELVAAATGATGRTPPVAALNPEAGAHGVTTDPRELAAALRAGELSWRRFRYYESRYGERGRRFTRSDSAWIVTLAHEPTGVAEHQLRWLGALLAARGMPRWLLEVHLEALHASLVDAVPEKRAEYGELLRVAGSLRDERLSQLDEVTCAELAAVFDQRVTQVPGAELPEAGALLVAAVADERAGLRHVVDSLTDWLADPMRFPEEWVAATSETVTAARELARR